MFEMDIGRVGGTRTIVNHMLRNLRPLLCISIPAVAVVLLAAEATLRHVGYVPYYLDKQAFAPSANEHLLYTLRPNYRGHYAGVPIQVNSLGLRGAELPAVTVASASLRVVIMGDSIAFGQGVREQETLSEQLRSRLQDGVATPVLVANLGVPGYDTCQEYMRFRELGLPLWPHIVFLLYYENDVDPTPFRVKNGIVYSPDVREGWFGDLMAGARRHSALYNLVWTRWQMLKHRFSAGNYTDLVTRKFKAGNPGWERSQACLENLIATTTARSIRVVVIPFPVLVGLSQNPYPLHGYIETVCGAVSLAGAECLDVVPLVRDPSLRLIVSSVETHPSADVYGRIAGHLALTWAGRPASAYDLNRTPLSNDTAAGRTDRAPPVH